jgi:hypothetical protein
VEEKKKESLFEIEEIILNAELHGKCHIFDNAEAINNGNNTFSSYEESSISNEQSIKYAPSSNNGEE